MAELFVPEELRLDAVVPVVAEFAPIAIGADEELEEPLSGLRLPRRPSYVVVEQIVLAHGGRLHRTRDR